MEFARGRDVTAMFHAIHWHSQSRASSILQRLPELHEDAARGAGAEPYVFGGEDAPAMPLLPSSKKSAFMQELHSFLSEEFPTQESMKATPEHWALVCLFSLLTFSCWWLWFQGNMTATLVLPIFHWLLVAVTFHEACHSTLSTNPLANYIFQFTAHPIFENVFIWYTQHLVSHHQYTNEEHFDSDIHVLGTTRMHSETPFCENPRPLLGTYGFPQFVLKLSLATIGSCFLGPRMALEDTPHPPFSYCIQPAPPGKKPELALSMVPSAFVILWPLFAFWSNPLQAAFLSIWPFLGASAVWSVMVFSSHVQEECQPAGTGDLAQSCWWARQAETSLDYSVASPFWTVVTAGLNSQSLHHLAPNICHCHFPRIYPRFAEICAQHGVRLNQRRDILSALEGLLSFAERLNAENAPGLTRP